MKPLTMLRLASPNTMNESWSFDGTGFPSAIRWARSAISSFTTNVPAEAPPTMIFSPGCWV